MDGTCPQKVGIILEATLLGGGKNPSLLVAAHSHPLCLAFLFFLMYLDTGIRKPKDSVKKFGDYGFLLYTLGTIGYTSALFLMVYSIFISALSLISSIVIVAGFVVFVIGRLKL